MTMEVYALQYRRHGKIIEAGKKWFPKYPKLDFLERAKATLTPLKKTDFLSKSVSPLFYQKAA